MKAKFGFTRSLVIVSVIVGALVAYSLLTARSEKTHLGRAPQKFVPAQTLRLVDSARNQLGSLSIASEGVMGLNLNDAASDPLADYAYNSDETVRGFHLYGSARYSESSSSASLFAMLSSEPDFLLHMPNGKECSVQGKGWTQPSGTLHEVYWIGKALAKAAYHGVVPEKPEHTIETVIPSEDLRLVDRKGHTFAVLGLSETAEPSMALLDSEEKLLVVWSLTQAGPFDSAKRPEWTTLYLFDQHGAMRVQVDLGPDPSPALTIFEKTSSTSADLGIYVLDPQTGQEVPKRKLLAGEEGAIPWLKHPMLKATLPLMLVDERNQVLWKSPF